MAQLEYDLMKSLFGRRAVAEPPASREGRGVVPAAETS